MSTRCESEFGDEVKAKQPGPFPVVFAWLFFGIVGELLPLVMFGATVYASLGDAAQTFGVIVTYSVIPAITFGIYTLAIGDAWLAYQYEEYRPGLVFFMTGLVLFALLCGCMGNSNRADVPETRPQQFVENHTEDPPGKADHVTPGEMGGMQRLKRFLIIQCALSLVILMYCALLKAQLLVKDVDIESTNAVETDETPGSGAE